MKLRATLLACGLAGLAGALVTGVAGLPAFGHYAGVYGTVIARVAVPERHATSLVAAVVFDYRGFDTLGEEFILLAAVAGVAALLRLRRADREAEEQRGDEAAPLPPEAGRALAAAAVGPVTVLGLFVIAHGPLSPGGGFQGGVVVTAAILLAYAGGQAFALRGLRTEPLLEGAEALGALGFALLGLAGLVFGTALLENVLPLGTVGDLLSGGTIPAANLAVGLEVAGGVALVLSEFLDQALLERRGRRP